MSNVIIMGAGPAGLAAGYELAKNGTPAALFEAEKQVGGISKTIEYKGYRFDLGGHRFFTKFDEVNELWREVLGDDFKETPRLSRIYYRNRFFNYPLTAANALFGMGFLATCAVMGSYIKARLWPDREEKTFEQWVSNRFGKQLYRIFFKTYTEKVWGIPCAQIEAEWAAQRIKGLSLKEAVANALFRPKHTKIKTLIDRFNYPVLGPGMMYDAMRARIEAWGGEVLPGARITRINHDGRRILGVEHTVPGGGTAGRDGAQFISSIPVTELIELLHPAPGEDVRRMAKELRYRSIVTIDIIVDRRDVFPDNWIYIHSPEVKLGRIQNFKNWSLEMVPDPAKTSLGLEYFCDEGDAFWNTPDDQLFTLAAREIEAIRICRAAEIEDYTVVRVPKAYPVYVRGYKERLDKIAGYLARFENLQLIGRYGLFKYNNMDHSIMTGLYAARNILHGRRIHDTWSVNTEEEYHEEDRRQESPVKKPGLVVGG
ncbi:MAG: NAD(P)/FAD-dependent oxidoreductase [Bacteroidota bacterium]